MTNQKIYKSRFKSLCVT